MLSWEDNIVNIIHYWRHIIDRWIKGQKREISKIPMWLYLFQSDLDNHEPNFSRYISHI